MQFLMVAFPKTEVLEKPQLFQNLKIKDGKGANFTVPASKKRHPEASLTL